MSANVQSAAICVAQGRAGTAAAVVRRNGRRPISNCVSAAFQLPARLARVAPRELRGTVVAQCPSQDPMFSGLHAKTLFHRSEIFSSARPVSRFSIPGSWLVSDLAPPLRVDIRFSDLLYLAPSIVTPHASRAPRVSRVSHFKHDNPMFYGIFKRQSQHSFFALDKKRPKECRLPAASVCRAHPVLVWLRPYGRAPFHSLARP